jgi:hypothetical protein
MSTELDSQIRGQTKGDGSMMQIFPKAERYLSPSHTTTIVALPKPSTPNPIRISHNVSIRQRVPRTVTGSPQWQVPHPTCAHISATPFHRNTPSMRVEAVWKDPGRTGTFYPRSENNSSPARQTGIFGQLRAGVRFGDMGYVFACYVAVWGHVSGASDTPVSCSDANQ